MPTPKLPSSVSTGAEAGRTSANTAGTASSTPTPPPAPAAGGAGGAGSAGIGVVTATPAAVTAAAAAASDHINTTAQPGAGGDPRSSVGGGGAGGADAGVITAAAAAAVLCLLGMAVLVVRRRRRNNTGAPRECPAPRPLAFTLANRQTISNPAYQEPRMHGGDSGAAAAAAASVLCAYRSPARRNCLNRTMGGGAAHCGSHMCPVLSCPTPKSSRQQMCAKCTSSGAAAPAHTHTQAEGQGQGQGQGAPAVVYSIPMEEDSANEYADASTILDSFTTPTGGAGAGRSHADYANAGQVTATSYGGLRGARNVYATDYGGLRGARAVYVSTDGDGEGSGGGGSGYEAMPGGYEVMPGDDAGHYATAGEDPDPDPDYASVDDGAGQLGDGGGDGSHYASANSFKASAGALQRRGSLTLRGFDDSEMES